MTEFNYMNEKQMLVVNRAGWQEEQQTVDKALELLNKFKQQTSEYAGSLCEQLRIVLEP
jgi:midasin (ATPase involved in ribosome maturation)